MHTLWAPKPVDGLTSGLFALMLLAYPEEIMCKCPKCNADLSAEANEKCKETIILPTFDFDQVETKPTTVVVYCSNGHDEIAIECECS